LGKDDFVVNFVGFYDNIEYMARVVAIDYGMKRIGLAIGDTRTRIAMPWAVVGGQGSAESDAQAVFKHIRSSGEKVDIFVVGLPRNMDGTEGPQSKISREFGTHLAAVSGAAVEYQDERLSSFTAERKFATPIQPGTDRRSGRGVRAKKMKKPKKPLDAVAAAVILESYFQGCKGGEEEKK